MQEEDRICICGERFAHSFYKNDVSRIWFEIVKCPHCGRLFGLESDSVFPQFRDLELNKR